MMKSGRTREALLLLAGAVFLAGCGGGGKFKNEPRPPAPVQLTGVITPKGVTISPSRVGGGPVIILVSNQTQRAHTLTLDGGGTIDTVGPINPLDTAKLQQTLKPGQYTIKAGSPAAEARTLKPGVLSVGPERASSSNQVLLP
jgi:hypothetical protein